MKSKKSIIIGVSILVLALGLVTSFVILLYNDNFDPIPLPFDSKSWKGNPGSSRFAMYRDLVKKYKIDGMNKLTLVQILGTPDSASDKLLVYEMGAAGPDSKTSLEIYLDGETVKSHKLIREM